jgi:hypothetical protein
MTLMNRKESDELGFASEMLGEARIFEENMAQKQSKF